MKHTTELAFGIALLTAALCACGGGSAGDNPQIDLDPAGTDVQMTTVYNVRVINSGDADLKILSAPVLAGGLCPDSTSAFTLEIQAGAEFPYVIAPADAVGADENAGLSLTVRFNDPTDLCSKNATLTITSNDVDTEQLVIDITKAVVEPNIAVDPNPVDMGFVPVAPTAFEDTMYITNSGLAPLEISRVDAIRFSDGFAFVWPCDRAADAAGDAAWVTDKDARIQIAYDDPETKLTIDDTICDAPVVVDPASSLGIPVFYTAISGSPARAIFRLYSNDPDFNASLGQAYEATLQANFGGPCLTVTPELIDFGTVVVGTGVKGVNVQLYNCGDEDLEITNIYYCEGTSDEFSLDLSTVDAFDESHPLVIEPGKTATVVAKYTPTDFNKDGTGKLIPDEGCLAVDNNSPRQTLETPVKGLGAEAECAVCQFEMMSDGVQLGDVATVNPQDLITFVNHSYDPTVGGGIESFNWTVDQPSDSLQIFNPTSTYENPTFEPNVVGGYEFCLEVFNKDGCSDKCCKTVQVNPPQGCHIELTWNTPSDEDQTDQCYEERDCGSDMDLHVVHPMATGTTKDPSTGEPYGFFDLDYDCYWMVPHPVWDLENKNDPLHQPNLDRDDTDGAGPENWTYTIPDPDYSTTPPACYRVGVHYYDDHTFGKSYPTIRVFIDSSTPVYEKTLTGGMSMLDMWDVGRVCCSNIDTPFVERVNGDGTPHIVHGYPDESIQ